MVFCDLSQGGTPTDVVPLRTRALPSQVVACMAPCHQPGGLLKNQDPLKVISGLRGYCTSKEHLRKGAAIATTSLKTQATIEDMRSRARSDPLQVAAFIRMMSTLGAMQRSSSGCRTHANRICKFLAAMPSSIGHLFRQYPGPDPEPGSTSRE